MFIALLGIVVSMLIIWRACDGFESATGYLGRNLSDGVRGATFNAIGSSLPELLATSAALLLYADKEGFAFGIGTTAGSAIFNSAVIPALVIGTVIFTGLATTVNVSRKVILRDGIALIACEFLLIYLLTNDQLEWFHGAILCGAYVTYVAFVLTTMTKGEPETYEDEPEEAGSRVSSLATLNLRHALLGEEELNTGKAWGLLLFATAFIAGACHILVESCFHLGEALEIKTYFVAVILAAAATSVPDTSISIKDAQAGEYDDAVANALGSNIFDICFCLGLPLLVFCLWTGETISIGGDTGNVAELRILLLGMTGVVFFVMLKSALGLLSSLVLLSLYGSFITFIVVRASGGWAEFGGLLQGVLKMIGG
jgi:cation:H+ antiporter